MALLANFEGYYPGYSRVIAEQLATPDLGRPQGAYRQPRRHGHAALGRPARPAADQLPLLRRRRTTPRERICTPWWPAFVWRAADGPLTRVRPDRRGGTARRRRGQTTRSWRTSCATRLGPPRLLHLRHRRRGGDGVLDSDFRVHGTTGLRVVDASVFPRIPGFFIASAVYMIGEKAADVILADALN